jgi:hypothetical protein
MKGASARQSHFRQEAFQGDTVCLRVTDFAGAFPAAPLDPYNHRRNRNSQKDLPSSTFRAFDSHPVLNGRPIAHSLVALKRLFAHMKCARSSKGPEAVVIVGAIGLAS